MIGAYEAAYTAWRQDPESFWEQAAGSSQWYRRWDKVLYASRPPVYRWFSGGLLNTCYNLLDAHVENGRADQPALIYDSPVTGVIKSYTYLGLLRQVAKFAGALRKQGVEKGDRVIVYMPKVPEAGIAMLACARTGAVHSVRFGGFA